MILQKQLFSLSYRASLFTPIKENDTARRKRPVEAERFVEAKVFTVRQLAAPLHQ
jgi:hypothetical protein